MLVDTHCHLDAGYFPEGPGEVIARAREAGVGHFVVIGVGETPAAAEAAVGLAAERDDVSATAGVHPHDAAKMDEAAYATIAALAARPEAVAVGEIGLDYHYDHSPREVQGEVFRRFIQLARQLEKPIVVHTRSAPEDTLTILDEEGAREVGGIIHCFSEDRAFARRALDMNLDISFSGIVTFKNAKAVHDVAQWAPLDRIMVETDSPYLAPVPRRGKRNEPAYVAHTAKRVAELRGITYDAIVASTTRVAERRLGLDLAHLAEA